MNTESRAKKESLPYNAQQRVQAVLSLWTERRGPADLCQELGRGGGRQSARVRVRQVIEGIRLVFSIYRFL